MEVENKMRCVKALIRRNADNPKPAENSGSVINFPFIGVTGFTQFRAVLFFVIKEMTSSGQAVLFFDRPFEALGDMDALKFM